MTLTWVNLDPIQLSLGFDTTTLGSSQNMTEQTDVKAVHISDEQHTKNKINDFNILATNLTI